MRGIRGAVLIGAMSAVFLGGPPASAVLFRTFVTGADPLGDVVFAVTLDPAIAGSATFAVAVRDSVRLDGIDYLPGSVREVAVGAQVAGGGAITRYDVFAGTVLPDFVPATGAGTRPSSILTDTPTGSHVYYTENQFGFGAGGLHRIMRTPVGGPAGATDLVFDGSAVGAGGLVDFEGLEIVAGRLYFFARSDVVSTDRALYSIGLDGAGLWDGAAPSTLLGGLTAAAAGDGSDELDFDPLSGLIFGSNVINGEVIWWDPVGASGGFLIAGAEILAGGPDLLRMATAQFDGIRSTGNGYLVLTGIDGVILSIDIAGAFAGVGDEDVAILYDRLVEATDLRFDDLTPMNVIPEPTTIVLIGLGLAALARTKRRHLTQS